MLGHRSRDILFVGNDATFFFFFLVLDLLIGVFTFCRHHLQTRIGGFSIYVFR